MDEQDKKAAEEGSRARNRTVMLTPEVTSQVRNRLAQELRDGSGSPSRGGFEPARSFGANAPRDSESSFGGGSGGDFNNRRNAPALPPPADPIAAHQAEERSEGAFWMKESPIVGFLVAYDRNEHGEVYELRSGRIMVTTASRAEENTLVLQDDTVSPMHAILRVTAEGAIQVLDQLSEHGTSITRVDGEQVSLSGDKGDLQHGDIVSFGARAFHVCIVPRKVASEG